jgi:UDP-N-acetylmuramoyl-tripeptide--D-alanyl-D-alanine ligase
LDTATLTLADVIEGLTGNRIEARQKISSVIIDSRQAKEGSLFVALPGQNSDGHKYVQQALEQGAIAAITHQPVALPEQTQIIRAGELELGQELANRDSLSVCIQVEDSLQGLQQLATFWRNKFKPRVIGITGSVGKSTTKELIWAVLSTHFNTLKSPGNYNNEIGLPLTLLNLNAAHERVVLEMGMYALGEIALLAEIARPQVGVVTNVEPVHLERLGTIERIAQAKTELVQALPRRVTIQGAAYETGLHTHRMTPTLIPTLSVGMRVGVTGEEDGVAILNYDDPRVQAMADKTRARIVTYGLSPQADLWVSDITSAGLKGIRFVFHYQGETIHARLPLLGRHSVYTALPAALVGLVEGLDWEEITAGLQALPSNAQLRLVAIPGTNNSILLDDTYNASPASSIAALNLLDDLTATKKVAVLGDMMELGSLEEEGHRKVGCYAANIVDFLIVVGSRARIIAAEAQACGLNPSLILELENNQAVADYLSQSLEPKNVVLIKGSNSQRMGEIISALAIQSNRQNSLRGL